MSKIHRYLAVLRRSRMGLDLPWREMANYLKHYLKPRESVMTPSRLAPVLTQLFITERCNLRCSFCIVGISGKSQQGEINPDMDTSFVEKVLSRELINKSLVIVLTGGEPLLNKDIISIVKTIKNQGRLCGMITNGLLLPDRLEALADARLDEIQLSVYDHTLERIEKILPSMCRIFPINASYVLLRSVIEKNPEQLEKLIYVCREAGCNSLKINLCIPVGDDTSESIYDDCRAYTVFVAAAAKRDKGFRVYYPKPGLRKIRGRRDKRCLIPWQQVFVNPLGLFSMCCNWFSLNGPEGDLFDDNDARSYNTPYLNEIRNYLLSDDTKSNVRCASCVHLPGAFSSRL